jgi:hypothetical protein
MPLPPNFSDWEHFQSTLIQVQNRRVREEFRGEDDDSIATPRASLKQACLLKDNDSAIQTLNRLWLFYVILQQAQALHPPIYSIPSDRYQQDVTFAPQVTLMFSEDRSDVEQGFPPVSAELSFRVKNERWDTFTPANAQALANRVRSEFASGQGYRWQKGRIKLVYRDKENGYLLTVNAFSESEGRSLITKVLNLQGDTLNLDHLTISRMGQNPSIMPPTRQVFGKQRRLPRKRPVAWVRFRYAELHIWGLTEAVILVDNTGRKPNALLYT